MSAYRPRSLGRAIKRSCSLGTRILPARRSTTCRVTPSRRARRATSPSRRYRLGPASGDRWLVHNLLFDGALNLLATVLPSDPGPGTIAPDGSAAYYPTLYGYEKVRLPDGVVLERVRIPPNDARLTVLPDGLRLVLSGAAGFTRVTVVDLR